MLSNTVLYALVFFYTEPSKVSEILGLVADAQWKTFFECFLKYVRWWISLPCHLLSAFSFSSHKSRPLLLFISFFLLRFLFTLNFHYCEGAVSNNTSPWTHFSNDLYSPPGIVNWYHFSTCIFVQSYQGLKVNLRSTPPAGGNSCTSSSTSVRNCRSFFMAPVPTEICSECLR